jgi:lipopolysaccharide export system protein LptA
MLMKRIRASGNKEPVNYDPDNFSLSKSTRWVSFLGNVHQEYLRRP